MPVQPPGVRTGAFTRPVHAHMYMHTSSLYMYMRAPVKALGLTINWGVSKLTC